MKGEPSSSNGRGEALYALSFLGAQLAFMPLLVLLLPRRVLAISHGHSLAALSGLLVLGGVVASLAHIAAGAIGDFWIARHGSRRAVIAAGLAGLLGAYGLLAHAGSIMALAVAVVCFQLTLNLMFAPLGALMTDYVPDARKGRVAGWLNAGLPLSGLMVTVIAQLAPTDTDASFFMLAALVAGLVLPLLLFWPFGAVVSTPPPESSNKNRKMPRLDRRDLVHAWVARLLMQLGALLLINYLYLYVANLRQSLRFPEVPDPTWAVGLLSLVASGTAILGAVAAGHGSDANGRRRWPMAMAALVAALALMALARPSSWGFLLLAYGAFQAALTAYLAIDAALVAQLVGAHPGRGAYLGFMNLTNTLPAIISPMLALATSARAPDSAALSHTLLVCAAASAAAAILVVRIRSLR